MKKILFIWSLFFLAVGCVGQETGFQSHSRDSGSDVSPSMDFKDQVEEIKRTVKVEVEVDISLEKTKRKHEGKPDTDKSPMMNEVAKINDGSENGNGNENESKTCSKSCTIGKENDEEKVSVSNMVDILFYLGHKKDGQCWSWLSHSIDDVSGFVPHMSHLDWQLSMAFSSDNPKLYALRSPGRRDGGSHLTENESYILKQKDFEDRKMDAVITSTIDTEYIRYVHDDWNPDSPSDSPGDPVFPERSKSPENPLGGLAKLLKDNPEGFIRKGSQVFIVLVDFNTLYETKKWESYVQQFEKQHENVNLIFISSKSQSTCISHVVEEEEFGFEWIPCIDDNVAENLMKSINR